MERSCGHDDHLPLYGLRRSNRLLAASVRQRVVFAGRDIGSRSAVVRDDIRINEYVFEESPRRLKDQRIASLVDRTERH